MFSFRKPSPQEVGRFLKQQQDQPFSYRELGMTASPPPGWRVARFRGLVGHGRSDFLRAVEAIRRWRMFPPGISELSRPPAPIRPGVVVTPLLRAYGLWILAACRIVYVIEVKPETETDEVKRFGFAYGTLDAHPECGEERFLVEWRSEDNTVWYELTAVSRHRSLISRIAHPLVRWAQNRFARRSVLAMQDAVANRRN